jgi:hypothetical protein
VLFGEVSIDVIQTPDEVAREEGALRASSDRVRLRRSSMIKPSSHSLLVVARRCGRVEWSRHPGALSTGPRCDDGYPVWCLKRLCRCVRGRGGIAMQLQMQVGRRGVIASPRRSPRWATGTHLPSRQPAPAIGI